MFCEWIWDGAIGKVHTIHAGCTAVNSGIDHLPRLKEQHEVPDDARLGPVARPGPGPPVSSGLPARRVARLGAVRQRHGRRLDLPRGRSGVLGARPRRAEDDPGRGEGLRLRRPRATPSPRARSSPTSSRPRASAARSRCTGTAAPSGFRGRRTWSRTRKPVDTGAVVLGDKGTIMYGSHGAGGVRIIPEAQDEGLQAARRRRFPRVKEHHQDWLEAIRNGTKAGSDFSYGGPLTEIAMLGVIAIKLPGTEARVGRRKPCGSPTAPRPTSTSTRRTATAGCCEAALRAEPTRPIPRQDRARVESTLTNSRD